jgi:hypothetical protein
LKRAGYKQRKNHFYLMAPCFIMSTARWQVTLKVNFTQLCTKQNFSIHNNRSVAGVDRQRSWRPPSRPDRRARAKDFHEDNRFSQRRFESDGDHSNQAVIFKGALTFAVLGVRRPGPTSCGLLAALITIIASIGRSLCLGRMIKD